MNSHSHKCLFNATLYLHVCLFCYLIKKIKSEKLPSVFNVLVHLQNKRVLPRKVFSIWLRKGIADVCMYTCM